MTAPNVQVPVPVIAATSPVMPGAPLAVTLGAVRVDGAPLDLRTTPAIVSVVVVQIWPATVRTVWSGAAGFVAPNDTPPDADGRIPVAPTPAGTWAGAVLYAPAAAPSADYPFPTLTFPVTVGVPGPFYAVRAVVQLFGPAAVTVMGAESIPITFLPGPPASAVRIGHPGGKSSIDLEDGGTIRLGADTTIELDAPAVNVEHALAVGSDGAVAGKFDVHGDLYVTGGISGASVVDRP